MQLRKKNITVMRKICKKCGEEKDVEEFLLHSNNNRRNICKICYSENKRNNYLKNKKQVSDKCRIYYEENKEYIKNHVKEYNIENKEQIKEKQKIYRENNKELIKENQKKYYILNKERYKEKTKKYREEKHDKILQNYNDNKEYYQLKNKNRRESHIEEVSENFKIYYNNHKEYFKQKKKEYSQSEKGKESKRKWCNEYNSKNKHIVLWRSLLRRTIVQLKQEKFDTTLNSLGYSAMELKEHIEKNWIEGMNWENYGEWYVDHIRSVGTFDSIDLPSVVNALSNLNPMWPTNRYVDDIFYEGNLNKGKKYN